MVVDFQDCWFNVSCVLVVVIVVILVLVLVLVLGCLLVHGVFAVVSSRDFHRAFWFAGHGVCTFVACC